MNLAIMAEVMASGEVGSVSVSSTTAWVSSEEGSVFTSVGTSGFGSGALGLSGSGRGVIVGKVGLGSPPGLSGPTGGLGSSVPGLGFSGLFTSKTLLTLPAASSAT